MFSRSRVDGFAFDVELFHLAEREEFSLREVPVRVVNSERSTVKVARDAYRLLVDLLRIRRWAKQGWYERDDLRRGAGPLRSDGPAGAAKGDERPNCHT